MKYPSPLPDHLSAVPFTVHEALDAGISRDRLKIGGLVTPSRGIRVPSDDGSGPECLMRLAQLARPHTLVTRLSAASHATAFLLREFPGFLPGADQPGVHISRPDAVTIARRRGVVGHRGQFFPDEIVELHGAFVTSRVRTWLDIARRMSVDELTVVADHLLRHPRPEFEGRSAPHATLDELADMLDRHKGTPGIRKARLAVEQARVGADSAPETRLRLALARRGFPDADVNVPVALGGGIVRQPDLAYPEFRVAVEYDGEGHSDPAQVLRDISRDEDFAAAGWILVRIGKTHMENDARAAARKVRLALLARGWSPSG
ncbi:endonuclease domain-containing protein [Arthrobacter sp. NPDC058097]|uniref:endonuclease domain-containing protein n=1 Tax=Arthrobacter sp. NPDC058097 TaxID=3346340 RepID=UPI0036DF2C51